MILDGGTWFDTGCHESKSCVYLKLTIRLRVGLENGSMKPSSFCSQNFFSQICGCWNWKCAVLSATARSFVYVAALAHKGVGSGATIVLVEMVYVLVTAGVYAGLQQKALGLRSQGLGNLAVVIGVPGLAQTLEWLTHRAVGGAAPGRATLAVCFFAVLSAFFHLHVMRRGAFLTGGQERSLVEDFRRMPQLVVEFLIAPVLMLSTVATRLARFAESESAL
jgi:hypothetical protein